MHNSTNVACDHVSEIDSKNLDKCSSSSALVAVIFILMMVQYQIDRAYFIHYTYIQYSKI